MAKIPIKIDFIYVFNQVINFVNRVNTIAEKNEETFEGFDWREISTIDVKFQIMTKHFEAIGTRALELNDPALIDLLMNVGILTPKVDETKDETKPAPIAEVKPLHS